MLTYELKHQGLPLYEALYRAIRRDIITGRIKNGERLPSKRSLSEHLQISKATVENAYAQLSAEGLVDARPRSGLFAIAPAGLAPEGIPLYPPEPRKETEEERTDLSRGRTEAERFPFSVWSRLLRTVMLEEGERLLLPTDSFGVYPLRLAIARYLYRMRGLQVLPEQILVGAGAEYLFQLCIQLLGRERIWGAGEPGYRGFEQVCRSMGAPFRGLPMDEEGIHPDALGRAGVSVVHLSPAHHFPTGIPTPPQRRRALLAYAAQVDGYIIEDDYDSEFRRAGKPLPPLFSQDATERVIYCNTFTRTLAPSLRIGYLVLPLRLVEKFRERLGFYASTVPSFEQYTLARFLEEGYFEKHLNRMKKHYRQKAQALYALWEGSPLATCSKWIQTDSELHVLLQLQTHLSDEELRRRMRDLGYTIRLLSDFCSSPEESTRTLVLGGAGRTEEEMRSALQALAKAIQ